MRIIVTDSGYIWNHENPFLKEFKESVIVVCLSGKKVTDEYKCFVSPYHFSGLGSTGYGVQSTKYKALVSEKGDLASEIGYHDDVLFLTDSNPESLYPYFVLRNSLSDNDVHLCAMSTLPYQPKRERIAHEFLLSDFNHVKSIFYWDTHEVLDDLKDKTLREAQKYLQNKYGEYLSKIFDGIINTVKIEKHYYFDFASESYIPLKTGYNGIDVRNRFKRPRDVSKDLSPNYMTLGLIRMPQYPSLEEKDKLDIEYLPPRVDGKIVCNVLKAQRIEIARVNNIPFETVDCPSIGPCAGTCERCDQELKFLTKKLREIPDEKRVYPKFDPEWEMLVWQEKMKK